MCAKSFVLLFMRSVKFIPMTSYSQNKNSLKIHTTVKNAFPAIVDLRQYLTELFYASYNL